MSYSFIPVSAFKLKTESREVLALDTRSASYFAEGFVPLSLNVPLNTEESQEIINVFGPQQPVIIICESDKIEESIQFIKKLGYPFIEGFLKDGFLGWKNAGENIDLLITIEADELAMDIPHDDNLIVLDVRTPVEYAEGHIEDAQSLPLMSMSDPAGIALLPENANLYLHCSNMVRSMIAAGIFKQHGLHNVRVVNSLWTEIKNTPGIKIENTAPDPD